VADIVPGTRPSSVDITFNPTPLGDALYFADNNRLWKTDGTSAGTQLVFELDPQSSIAEKEFVTLDQSIIFAMEDSSYGAELWRTDGTATGTRLVADIVPGSGSSNPQQITLLDGFVYFTAENATHTSELWRTDGTPEGMRWITSAVPPDPFTGSPELLVLRP